MNGIFMILIITRVIRNLNTEIELVAMTYNTTRAGQPRHLFWE